MRQLTRRAPRSLLRALCALALAASMGCGASGQSDEAGVFGGSLPAPNCTTSADCGEGYDCHAVLSVCTASDGQQRSVALKVEPLAASALVPSHLRSVKIGSGQPHFDVTLPEPIRLQGRVRVMDNPLETSVEAFITAVAKEEVIPGEVRSSYLTATNDFELFLQRDVTYELQITAPGPDGGRPTVTQTVRYSGDADETFWVAAVADLPSLAGRVVKRIGGATLPIEGVRVHATPVGGGQACTTAITGKLGDYTLRCNTPGDYVITVMATSDGPVVPRFDARILWGASYVDALPVAAGANAVPDVVVPGEREERDLSVQVRGGDGAPLHGATVKLTAALLDGETWRNARFELTGTTDRTGIASVRALDGTYDLSITPPTDSEWASYDEAGWEVALREARAIELTRRPVVSGVVHTASGALLPDARVVLREAGAASGGGEEFITVTDELGEYALPVDVGDYEVSVEPTVESGQPVSLPAPLSVSGDLEHPLTLPAPLVLQGTVTSAAGALVPYALVEALHAADASGKRYVFAGRARTDVNGEYFLILPLDVRN